MKNIGGPLLELIENDIDTLYCGQSTKSGSFKLRYTWVNVIRVIFPVFLDNFFFRIQSSNSIFAELDS